MQSNLDFIATLFSLFFATYPTLAQNNEGQMLFGRTLRYLSQYEAEDLEVTQEEYDDALQLIGEMQAVHKEALQVVTFEKGESTSKYVAKLPLFKRFKIQPLDPEDDITWQDISMTITRTTSIREATLPQAENKNLDILIIVLGNVLRDVWRLCSQNCALKMGK